MVYLWSINLIISMISKIKHSCLKDVTGGITEGA